MIGYPTMLSTDQDLDLLFGGTTRNADGIIRRLRSSDPGDLTLPKPLPSPRQLQEDPDLIWVRYDGIVMLRQVSQFTIHDTPVASLYRICEFICADQPNQVMLETITSGLTIPGAYALSLTRATMTMSDTPCSPVWLRA
jgi:hypothetical protein